MSVQQAAKVGGGDICASLICHNTLRLLGRYYTYNNTSGANFTPLCGKKSSYYIHQVRPQIHSQLMNLRINMYTHIHKKNGVIVSYLW